MLCPGGRFPAQLWGGGEDGQRGGEQPPECQENTRQVPQAGTHAKLALAR